MRIFKTLIIAAFAFATAAGTLLAADDPLEIHGGGRVGWSNNSKLGGEKTGPDNELGSVPNYGTSNYMSLSFSKKVTAEGGAWAKTVFAFDDWRQYVGGDLTRFTLRLRDFHEEFGGLDFLPAGAVLWGGLKGIGAGWNGQQDHSFINFAGLGFGLQNLGGVFSVSYLSQQFTNNDNSEEASWNNGEVETAKLGYRVAHNIVASINIPVADIFGAYAFSKKATGEKNYTAAYVGGIYHAPVLGLNIGAAFATNGMARMMMPDRRSDTFIRGNYFSGTKATIDASKYTAFSLSAWTVTDLAPGLYTATSISFDQIKGDKNATDFTDNTKNWFTLSSRWSKAVTKNLAVTGTIGIGRWWDKEKTLYPDPLLIIQVTPGVEIGLDTGYWAGQKLQFFGTYEKRDSKNKFSGGAADGKTSKVTFGSLVSFGF